MAGIYPPRSFPPVVQRTEFDVLKSSHKFLRDDTEDEQSQTWENKVARKFYSSLFREYAVCDLKHYKSGMFSMRWRTEEEVLSGAGETTCGNTRCDQHEPLPTKPNLPTTNRRWDDDDELNEVSSPKKKKRRGIVTLELPFSYEEDGETKNALVKVVLCDKCHRKMNWKREKSKQREYSQDLEPDPHVGSTEHQDLKQHEHKHRHSFRSRSRSPKSKASAMPVLPAELHRSRRRRSRSPPRYDRNHDIRDAWNA